VIVSCYTVRLSLIKIWNLTNHVPVKNSKPLVEVHLQSVHSDSCHVRSLVYGHVAMLGKFTVSFHECLSVHR
jgi:hypothetical protein